MSEESVGALLIVTFALMFSVIGAVAPQYLILTMVATVIIYMLIRGD